MENNILNNNILDDDVQKNENITKYLNSLSEIEFKALEIAKKQLESSFCLEKSIGFLEFLKKHNLKS
tara:strand:- start:252 stop:452 length:201 start_codon:yes stop_codon:yes gene_type:complete